MFAKIFNQIFDSSIAEKPEVRFTFMDLLILADIDGVVKITPEAIARRTNRPLDLIIQTLSELELPDPRSQSKTAEGRRIQRLSADCDWGWIIINYQKYRDIANECQRREDSRERVRKFRKKHGINGLVTPPSEGKKRDVTSGNGAKRNVMQELEAKAEAEAEAKLKSDKRNEKVLKRLSAAERALADRFERALGVKWTNDAGKWINRMKMQFADCECVIDQTESAVREGRVDKTPAAFAENLWKGLQKAPPLDDGAEPKVEQP